MKKLILFFIISFPFLSRAHPHKGLSSAKVVIEERTRNRLANEVTIIKQLPAAVKRCIQMRGVCSNDDKKTISQGITRLTFVITALSVSIPIAVHFYKRMAIARTTLTSVPTLTPIQRMHHAVQSSNVGALADLLKIYQPTKDELQELLHIAVTSFDPATVTLLLNQPTKLSFYPQGKEPLLKVLITQRSGLRFATSIANAKEVLKILLEHGADPNITFGKDNWTPLMQAAFADLDDMAQMLVKHGAKKELTDNQGKTAHDLAIENNAAKTAYFVSFIPKLAPNNP